jgi:hypothetical protein
MASPGALVSGPRECSLTRAFNLALGSVPASACPAFQDTHGQVNITQLILAVNNALNGCPR